MGRDYWICKTRVTLTRFSVPLIPNTHDVPYLSNGKDKRLIALNDALDELQEADPRSAD